MHFISGYLITYISVKGSGHTAGCDHRILIANRQKVPRICYQNFALIMKVQKMKFLLFKIFVFNQLFH